MMAPAAVVLVVVLTGISYGQDTPSASEVLRVAPRELGHIYRRVAPVPTHVRLTKNAEQGNVVAQVRLGDTYADGEGVEQDYAKAMRWYRAAAEQGSGDGRWRLGVMYLFGWGSPKDYAGAVHWFRAAAEQGNPEGQWLLGAMYASGLGVPRDFTEAGRWFRDAAEQGNGMGQWLLGKMYRYGAGIEQDYIAAYAWLNLAAVQKAHARHSRDLFVGDAGRDRDELAELMTAQQIGEAQRMARELWERIEAASG